MGSNSLHFPHYHQMHTHVPRPDGSAQWHPPLLVTHIGPHTSPELNLGTLIYDCALNTSLVAAPRDPDAHPSAPQPDIPKPYT